MTEHPLEPHIFGIARCLNLTGIVIVENPIQFPGHRHGSGQSLPHIDDLGSLAPDRQEAAERDELSRNWRNADDQQRGTPQSQPHCRGLETRSGKDDIAANGQPHQHPGNGGKDDQDLLRVVAADRYHEYEARAQRPDNGPDGVGRIQAAHQSPWILSASGCRGQSQGKTRAPEDGRWKHRPQRPHEIQLKVDPRIGGNGQVYGPVRQGLGHHVRRPADRQTQSKLAPSQRQPRLFEGPRECGSPCTSNPKPQ